MFLEFNNIIIKKCGGDLIVFVCKYLLIIFIVWVTDSFVMHKDEDSTKSAKEIGIVQTTVRFPTQTWRLVA